MISKKLGLFIIAPSTFSALLVSYLLLGSSYPELQTIKSDPTHAINVFSTDGCSGGMSVSWRWLSETLPIWGKTLGKAPPWESCCLAHDETYWHGGSRQERKQSDQALKECVTMIGYPTTAALMYYSVRLGGAPCTGLSWRWGYGWRDC